MFGDRVDFGAAGRPAFGRAAANDPVAPPPLTARAAARSRVMARRAAELLPELPGPGEHVHCLMTGLFDLCQVIIHTARRTRCRALRIATLCWNKRNVVDLAGLMEERGAAGDPLPLTVLASVFHREHNRELWEWAAGQLAPFPLARLAAARTHAKVTCLDLGPGDALVMEGSANLRTNQNREQLVAIRDRDTHDWHAGWIDALAGGGRGT